MAGVIRKTAVAANPFSLRTLRGAGPTHMKDQKFLRMLIFGKPGSGKGTLSSRLVNKFNINMLSTGDLLRQHIAEKTEVGQQAESIMARGDLLPDEIVLKVVTSKLEKLKYSNWILDGFPRTLGQGELLDAHLQAHKIPLSLVVNLDVPDDVIISRIADRWIHQPSGRIYNLAYNKPRVAGHDDVTGEPLTKRPDDTPEVFKKRLAQYYSATSPLLEYYQSPSTTTAPLAILSGSTSDEIWPQLEAVVRRASNNIFERALSIEGRRRSSLSDATSLAQEYGNAASVAMEPRTKL